MTVPGSDKLFALLKRLQLTLHTFQSEVKVETLVFEERVKRENPEKKPVEVACEQAYLWEFRASHSSSHNGGSASKVFPEPAHTAGYPHSREEN